MICKIYSWALFHFVSCNHLYFKEDLSGQYHGFCSRGRYNSSSRFWSEVIWLWHLNSVSLCLTSCFGFIDRCAVLSGVIKPSGWSIIYIDSLSLASFAAWIKLILILNFIPLALTSQGSGRLLWRAREVTCWIPPLNFPRD